MNDLRGVATAPTDECLVARFTSADFAPRERLAACRELYGRTLSRRDIEPLANEPFATEATLRRMRGLGLVTARRSAAIYRLRREFIDSDDVVMTVGLTSSYEVHHLARAQQLAPGAAIVMTGSEPIEVRVPRTGDYINVRVPRGALAPLVEDLDAAYGRAIPADTPALRLLTRYVGLLDDTESLVAAELRQQAVTHIHDLMALAIGETRDAADAAKPRGARAVRLIAIKQDIAARIGEPDLSVMTIAARHRIKPRWLQRLFEAEDTTFTDYVLAQRLVLAHRMLTDPRRTMRKISTIALEAGFGDLSYFNRAFRRRYGLRPSELRVRPTGTES